MGALFTDTCSATTGKLLNAGVPIFTGVGVVASTSHWEAVCVVGLVDAFGPGLTRKLEIGVLA